MVQRSGHYSDGGSHTLWHNSGSYHSPGGTTHNSTFTVPETAASFQLSYQVILDKGWLAYSEPILTGWSDWVTGTPGQAYDFSARVAGQTESYGGRIRVHYDNGEHKNMWHTDNGSYNSPGGTVQENDFTLPTNANQFRFSYRVRLDKGWLAFNTLKLTGWSDTIPVTGGEQYELSLHLAGELQALAEQGGQVTAHYNTGLPTLIWQNPANFNSGGTSHSQSFTPPPDATEMQIGYEVIMDKGWLAFSEAALSHLGPAYTITRKSYAFAGRTIATRISGNQEGDNGLFYIHADHLGSTSIMSYGQGHAQQGEEVDGSEARYLPFGDWRMEPSHELTDQGFTGQKHNMDLGLYYYNARFYLPGIGRFASADTLVPDPSNPQQYNRYTYVLNNPLRYSDPTGHVCYDHTAGPELLGTCVNEDGSTYSLLTPPPPTQAQQGSNIYGIIFTADAGKAWTQAQMVEVLHAAQDIEARFRSTGLFNGYAAGQIWREIFGPITIHRSAKTHWTDNNGNQHAIDYGAQVFSSRIEVYDAASNIPFNFRLNMVHEFGHRFNAVTVNATNMDPYNELDVAISERVLPLRNDIRAGMPGRPYQQSPFNTTNNELFADMFLNWTYRSFVNNPEGGDQRTWMNSRMPVWLGR